MKKDYEKMDFEELMKELEAVTAKLESTTEKLSLDESVKLFEEGMILSSKCNEKLESAEKKITMLINNDGNISEENFTVE